MIFEYTGRHIDVTPALRSHAEEHFVRIDHALNGKATKAHIILEVERGRHRAEVIVNWNGDVLTAATTNPDMYQSLSQTIDKIEKQALKLKEKIIDKYHRAEKKNAVFLGQDQEVMPPPAIRQIISEDHKSVKPVTAEEAALLLEDQDRNFLVFRNSENERISVIYKRNDGNYGLIEP
ncbi:MAG: ribosome-associated translation inhibitor RaiA [Saprospiraceae bacterium]|nr:ribosome-associated translation inhibitor RaiA [Pyrinomonadaceae bacterium]